MQDLNSFLRDLFCMLKMDSCEPKDTGPVHAPSFSSVLQSSCTSGEQVNKGADSCSSFSLLQVEVRSHALLTTCGNVLASGAAGKPVSTYMCFACICAQSRPPLLEPVGSSLPGSSVHGIFQARILEWVAISSSRGSTCPGIELVSPASLHLQADSLPLCHLGSPYVFFEGLFLLV